jgi:hypothetical protein
MTGLSHTTRAVWALNVLVVVGSITYGGQPAHIGMRDQIRGTWILRSIYPTQNVQGPNPSEQRKLLSTQIVIDATSIKACGQSVPIKSTDVKEVSATDFLAENLVPLDSVGIHKSSVTEVLFNQRRSGTCFGAFPIPGQDVYIKSRDEMVVAFEGAFYRAVRKK